MRVRPLLPAAILMAAVIAFPLFAAAQPACNAPLTGPGRALAFRDPLAEADRQAMSAAVFLALSDDAGRPDATRQAIEAAPPCPISTFEVDDVTWKVSGAAAPAPLRYARALGVETFYYLTPGPSLAQAAAWRASGRRGRVADAVGAQTYLVAVEDDLHFVFRVYDGAPDARGLANDLAAIIGGRIGPIAMYDPEGDAVSLALNTEGRLTAEIFRPDLLDGPRNATLLGPDGFYFTPYPGGVRLQGSGQICADAYGPMPRTRLVVLEVDPSTLDLGCSFRSDAAVVSVFSTRRREAGDDRAYFRRQIREAQAEFGAKRRTPIRAAERKAGLLAGEFWIDLEDRNHGLWFLRRGDFVIEFRATFQADALDAVFDALKQVVGNVAPMGSEEEGPA